MFFDRVLIADPDEPLRQRYSEFLTRDGFQVATAANGLECAAQLRRFRPDVLVLEPALPWGQGDGVLALMHEEADVPLASVIVLTAMRDVDALCRVLEFPLDDFVRKPLEPSQLARKIHRLLNTKPAAGKLHNPRDAGRHLTPDEPAQDDQLLTHFYQR
ncbi:MAG: response regulator [Planctomycetota bacterium]|nr:response regulator [Planctomycetota bacterium]